MMKPVPFLLTYLLISSTGLYADEADKDTIRTFTLGEVTVMEKLKRTTGTEITQKELDNLGSYRITDALNLLPGITISNSGDRNEGQIFMRGFDQRQIPVFMDGIPVYVPYDGMIDLNRLQTAPVSRIQLSKGMSSLLLGGNTMGGAVNIISTRPIHKLELNADVNTLWNAGLNLGSRLEKFYFQVGGNMLLRADFRLPSSFKPIEGIQEGRHLDHSSTDDYTFYAKAGFTPTENQEYTVGYSLIRSNKDIPVYLGEAGRKKYWRYKHWDKDQVFFHSRTAFSDEFSLETRAFYDKYYNELDAYDDNTYSTQDSKSSFTSIYDDYAAGGAITFNWLKQEKNTLKWGMNGKYDAHRSHNIGEPVATQTEYTMSLAAEDTWQARNNLTILAAVGYFRHKGVKAENYEQSAGSKEYGIVDYPLSSDHDLNYQAAIDYLPAIGHNFRFSVARNSRFASLKERYSFKMGKAWPNPDLKTEHAVNLDLNYEGQLGNLNWMIDGYYIFISDIIQEITGVDPDDPLIWQLQNRGKAHYRGVETGLDYTVKWFTASMNYTFTDQVNRTDKDLKFVDVPRHKVNIFLTAEPFRKLQLRADMNYNSKRYSSSDGSTSVPGFALFNVSAQHTFCHSLTARVGVNNLFDKLYYVKEGYPQPGRMFYASLRYNFVLH